MSLRYTKKDKQNVVNEYLNQTGRNIFVPSEFHNWLQDNPNHKLYDYIFSASEKEMAYKYRLNLIRQFASGLRLTIKISEMPMPSKIENLKVVNVPSLISPINNRANGGGYISVDVQDSDTMSELALQAHQALKSWKGRYAGTCALSGIDISEIDSILEELKAKTVKEEAA